MALDWKLVLCCGLSDFTYKINKEILKNLLFQTVRDRAFIFGMKHHLVGLYQNTSNYGRGVEIKPMLWGLGFHIKIKMEIVENLLVPNCKR